MNCNNIYNCALPLYNVLHMLHMHVCLFLASDVAPVTSSQEQALKYVTGVIAACTC